MSDPPDGSDPSMQRVHVRNLASTVTVEELAGLCRALGVHGEVHLARDLKSGRWAGEAYIAMPTIEAADEAAARLDGRELGGAVIEAERVGGDEFFDRDGLFADGAAPMGRQDGRGPLRLVGAVPRDDDDA